MNGLELGMKLLRSADLMSGWKAYGIETAQTKLYRISLVLPDGSGEFQINRIWHAKAAHFHRSAMMSLIVRNGYWWQLQQKGAAEFVRLFAAPGSIVSMGPEDVHLIEETSRPSISFCWFGMAYGVLPGMHTLTPVDRYDLWDDAKLYVAAAESGRSAEAEGGGN